MEKDLWFHFKRWGDVRELFISKKRNKMGRRYGFVRFKGVSDVRALERQLDNLVVGGLKLFVNVPKYDRDMGRPAPTRTEFIPQEVGSSQRLSPPQLPPHHQRAPAPLYATVLRRDIRTPKQRRHVENVSSGQGWSQSSAHINIPEETKPWLSEAWVGRVKNMSSFDKVEDELSWELGAEIVPKYLGDDMTLLLGLLDTKAEEMVNEEAQSGTTPFYSLEKWNPNIRTGHRLTWALCWGIPLVAWDIEYFRKIVAAIGDLVEVDDDVEELRRLDWARMLIRTSRRPSLQHTVNLHISKEVHQVHIVEEATPNVRKCTCSGRSNFGSSEEISSFDGDTDGTNPSEEGALGTDKAPPGIDGNSAVVGEFRGKSLLPGGKHPNGRITAVEPVDNNFGTWCTASHLVVSASGSLNGKLSKESPNAETEEGSDKVEIAREERFSDVGITEEQTKVGDLHYLGNVDPIGRCQALEEGDYRGPQLAISSELCNTGVARGEQAGPDDCNIPLASCDADIGPSNMGLPNFNDYAADISQQYPSPIKKTSETPGTWKVYSRGRWCKKKMILNSMDRNLWVDKATCVSDPHAADTGPMNLDLSNYTNAAAQQPKVALETYPVVTPDHHQEAEHHWSMVKKLGMTCDMNQDSIIESFWAMENRDRKEAEKLGNRIFAS